MKPAELSVLLIRVFRSGRFAHCNGRTLRSVATSSIGSHPSCFESPVRCIDAMPLGGMGLPLKLSL
jgi:hypothetical protein